MREKTSYWQIAQSSEYQTMVKQKSQVVTKLTWIVLSLFGLFTAAAIFFQDFIASPVFGESGMPWGVVFSILYIIIAVACSGYYTVWANNKFDRLQANLLANFDEESHDVD